MTIFKKLKKNPATAVFLSVSFASSATLFGMALVATTPLAFLALSIWAALIILGSSALGIAFLYKTNTPPPQSAGLTLARPPRREIPVVLCNLSDTLKQFTSTHNEAPLVTTGCILSTYDECQVHLKDTNLSKLVVEYLYDRGDSDEGVWEDKTLVQELYKRQQQTKTEQKTILASKTKVTHESVATETTTDPVIEDTPSGLLRPSS